MRLAPLLASLSDSDLDRLAIEHVRTDEKLPRLQLCNFLEGALHSYRFVSSFIINRQPPTFAMLTLLLEAPGYEIPISEFRDRTMAETRRLMELIDSGDLLARDRQLHLYRRALYEARRNDLDVNSSEAALLALLRREKEIAQVEHFLIEHHQDFREFWLRDDAFEHEQNALHSGGLLFHIQDKALIPEEVAPAIWQTLGIDMSTASARRLLSYLSNGDLASALEDAGSKISGSKEARAERLILERIQPRFVLKHVGLSTLKDICRETAAFVSGNKEELIDRIISHFAEGKDQAIEEPPEPARREPRRLIQEQFETMFSALLHQDLSDILRRLPELRQTGTKEVKIRTLWDAHLSEITLLGELMNRQLEDLLIRVGLRFSGSKQDRIERLITHFSHAEHTSGTGENVAHVMNPQVRHDPVPADIAHNQTLFRQKSSNPQASLQPWLDNVLEGNGLVRCYATEDENPTKQLKNKLSQAAAARDGLLVLLLADEAAYRKAHEALLERWMTNAEWPKSVSCVALAFPLSDPSIAAIIERTRSTWGSLVRSRLFPNAEILTASGGEDAQIRNCGTCAHELPIHAKFCPNCGERV
jgi:hypothetical protein